MGDDSEGIRERQLYGAIEAGGTKFVCAVGRSPLHILAEARVATTTPAETLNAAMEFFAAAEAQFGGIRSFGACSFGPIQLDRASPRFGCILATPKPHWEGADLASPLRQRFGRPIAIDTDVGGAALAEHRIGAGKHLNSLAYVTVGTGIGAGFVVDGRPLRGMMHSEAGHIAVRRHALDSDFPGLCPFHGDCLEGLCSGPAIEARWHAPLSALGDVELEIVGYYLGQLAANVALMISSERIVFGGGVMATPNLLMHVRQSTAKALNTYLQAPAVLGDLREYITPPALGERSGVIGAMLLAMEAT